MPLRIRRGEGSYFLDPDPTLAEWVIEAGGRFARLVKLRMINGALHAGIRTKRSWDPEYIPVPENVKLTYPQYRSIDGGQMALLSKAKPEDGDAAKETGISF